MTTARGWLAISAAMVVCACASSGSAPRQSRQDRNTLTAENLAAYPGRSLLDVIRRERPHWLGNQGSTSLSSPMPDGVVVYQDGARLGGPGYLGDIHVEIVESARFLTGPEAASRFGLNHQYGAILVTLRK